jgi:hypothetical protein
VRNLVLDFNLTVLLPLILVVLGVLWNLVRTYVEARSTYKTTLKRIERPFDTREEEDEFLEWGSKRCTEWRKARNCLWFPSVVLIALCALLWMPGVFTVSIAEGLWSILWFASVISFIVAIPMAWHYAKEFDWLKFGICLLAMLMLAASAEHFFHQKINARHVICPHCSDDDDRPDDN